MTYPIALSLFLSKKTNPWASSTISLCHYIMDTEPC